MSGGPRPFRTVGRVRENLEHIQGCDWKRAAIVWAFTYDAPRGRSCKCSKRSINDRRIRVVPGRRKPFCRRMSGQAIGLTAATKKGNRKMGKKNDDADLAKAIGVSLAGGSSTVIDRMTDAELAAMVRSAGRQTQANNTAGRGYPVAALKAFEDRVTDAKARYAAAGNDYEKTSAEVEWDAALRPPGRWRKWSSPRTFGRTAVAAAAAVTVRTRSTCSTSSLNIGEDRQVKGF